MSDPSTPSSALPPLATGLKEVRYSLPVLLEEVHLERSSPIFTIEKLDQVEIAKLFQKNKPRRAIRNRK